MCERERVSICVVSVCVCVCLCVCVSVCLCLILRCDIVIVEVVEDEKKSEFVTKYLFALELSQLVLPLQEEAQQKLSLTTFN